MTDVLKYLLICLLLFPCPFIQGQQRVVDSLVAQLELHKSRDTTRVKLLSKISSSLRSIDPAKMRTYGMEALELSKTLGYEKGIGFASKNVSVSYWAQGDYEQALKFAFEGLALFEKINYKRGLMSMYDMLGLIYEEQEEYEQALHYHQQVLRLNEGGNPIEIAGTQNNIGTVYYKMKEFTRAVESFHKAVSIYEAMGNKSGMAELYNNIGFVYKDQGKYQEAVHHYLQSIKLAQEVDDKRIEALVCNDLGEVFILMKDYVQANEYLQHGLVVAKKFRSKKWIKEIYGKLKDLKAKQGDYTSAFTYQHQEHLYNDSLYNEEKSKQIAEMQVQYETQKKEQVITQLQREKEVQALWRNFLVAGIVVALLLGLLIYQNLHLRNRKNVELLEAQQDVNRQLEELDRMRSRFVTNISHEFRTPLTLILGPLEQKIASSQDAHEKELSTMMYRNGQRLLQLTNQILDLSRLKNKSLKLHFQRSDITTFISQLANSFDLAVSQKGLRYNKQIPQEIVEADFDADKFEKIVSNLLSNALKFTPAGGEINVAVTYLNESPRFPKATWQNSQNNFVEIKVTDTGKGIPKEHLPKLFDAFYQAEEVHASSGIGVGLAIVMELVKIYRGFIDVVSEPGEGTTFIVTLPIHKEYYNTEEFITEETISHSDKQAKVYTETLSENQPDVDNDSAERESPILLVIEDSADLRNYVKEIFKQFFIVYEATDGEEGVVMASQHIPDAIILDVMLPTRSGNDVCQQLKTNELTSHIPIVMLTAKADMQSKMEGLKTGADDYVTKPFHVEELQIRILNLVNQREKLREQFQRELRVQPQNITVTPVDELFLKKAIAVVEMNITSPELGVDMLVKELGMSRSQLHRKLKALTGQAARDFIRDLRLKRAAQLIEQRADSVTQIAFMVGFNDPPHFTKSFRKLFGVSPSEYASSLN